jgi:hypothetical protein
LSKNIFSLKSCDAIIFCRERKQIDSISGLVDNFLDFIEQPLHAIDPLVFNLHHEFSDESCTFSIDSK